MAPPDQPQKHIPYKITGQERDADFTPGGGLKPIWHVTFEAPNGTQAYIDVPDNLYTPAYVDQLIEAELERIMGIHSLGPQPHPDNLAQ